MLMARDQLEHAAIVLPCDHIELEDMPKMAMCPNMKRARVFAVVSAVDLRCRYIPVCICKLITICAVFQTNFACETAVRQTLNSQHANIVVFASEYLRNLSI
jgi:hypothetical protein